MDDFTIKAELKASIYMKPDVEVRFLLWPDPFWQFEVIKETGRLPFIKRIETYVDDKEYEVVEYGTSVSMDTVTRAPGTVLKGILVEMIFEHLKSIVSDRSGLWLNNYMAFMIYAPDTCGFFYRRTFDRILRGPWFEENVSFTGSVEKVMEDGTTLCLQFDDTDISTVYRNGEEEGKVRLLPGSPAERRKGKKPLEEQMEFTYQAYGDAVHYSKGWSTGPFFQPWYTDRYHWKWSKDSDMDSSFNAWRSMDTIKGVDSISDILEAIRLYDKYHENEGRNGLMTEKIEKALLAVDEEELSKIPKADWKVVVMYFDPCNLFNQWLIVSGKKYNGDWILYGLVYLLEWEWGSVSLSQLEEAAHRPEDHPSCHRILREIGVSGQRLEDVLKTHCGRPGWEELL